MGEGWGTLVKSLFGSDILFGDSGETSYSDRVVHGGENYTKFSTPPLVTEVPATWKVQSERG